MSDLLETFIATAAGKLGETDADPIAQLRRIVERAGAERVAALVKDATAIHRNGGLLVLNGSRYRTLGGCFFYLAERYAGLSKADRKYCFPRPCMAKAADDKSAALTVSGDTFGRTISIADQLKSVNTRQQKGDTDATYPKAPFH